jgi:hypothetical protein
MKTFLSFVVVMMMSVMTSFGQVYVVHVDTLQYFEHPATVTTFDAMENDMVTYTNAYVSNIDFTFDFNKSKVVTNNHYTNFQSNINMIKKMDVSENFEIDVLSEDNKILRVFVDDGEYSYEGKVIYVRWNEMVNGESKTIGWASRNIQIKKRGN